MGVCNRRWRITSTRAPSPPPTKRRACHFQRLHPNRDARPRAGEAVVRVTAPRRRGSSRTARAASRDGARRLARTRKYSGCVDKDHWAWGAGNFDFHTGLGASQAARLLLSETGLAPYGSPLALELRRGGAPSSPWSRRVGTAIGTRSVRKSSGPTERWQVASMARTSRVDIRHRATQHATHTGRGPRPAASRPASRSRPSPSRRDSAAADLGALLAALLLALAAAAPRPSSSSQLLPRPQTEGFWKTTLLEWSRGSEGERGVWRALVAEDGAVEFAYPQDAATTLFWSETADRALRAVSPWFVRLAARKAEVTPDQRVADLEAAPRDGRGRARAPREPDPRPRGAAAARGVAGAAVGRGRGRRRAGRNRAPPAAGGRVAARSPRPEADDDDAAPAAAASSSCGGRRCARACSVVSGGPMSPAPAPAPPPPDTADDEAIARLLAAEYASPPVTRRRHRAAARGGGRARAAGLVAGAACVPPSRVLVFQFPFY